MYRKSITRLLVALAVLFAGAITAFAADATVGLRSDGASGAYLVDAKGMTLYYFTKDTPGQSACAGDCLVKWPPLTGDAAAVGPGLEAGDFGLLSRDGASQVTFRGYPLYRFFKDEQPGDRKGQGVNNVWYVIDPAAFPTAR